MEVDDNVFDWPNLLDEMQGEVYKFISSYADRVYLGLGNTDLLFGTSKSERPIGKKRTLASSNGEIFEVSVSAECLEEKIRDAYAEIPKLCEPFVF